MGLGLESDREGEVVSSGESTCDAVTARHGANMQHKRCCGYCSKLITVGEKAYIL